MLCIAMMNPHEIYKFDDIEIEKDLYHLLCCFLASRHVSELAIEDYEQRGNDGIHIFNMFLNAFEKQNIQELLISIAVRLRMIDDRLNTNAEKEINGDINDVGRLTKTAAKDGENILTIRDACNKIIHATLIEYSSAVLELKGKKKTYLKPELFLYDKMNKSGWKVRLDIIKFVKIGTAVCEMYDARSYIRDA
jgi:hypothetical protein